MKALLRQAYEAASQGYSPDRVVADPDLDSAFLSECRKRHLTGSDTSLNRALLNLRKRGELRGLRSRRTVFPNQSEYRFAAEMAARFIERRNEVSVDDILCNPDLAKEFDALASRLAPGFSPVEYRWAALNLRKASRLKPEIAARLLKAESVETLRVASLCIDDLAPQQGLYIFYSTNTILYVGEAENLQNRLRKHLDHSDNKGLARWMWNQGTEELHVELHFLPQGTSSRARRALETELIASRNSIFNIRR